MRFFKFAIKVSNLERVIKMSNLGKKLEVFVPQISYDAFGVSDIGHICQKVK